MIFPYIYIPIIPFPYIYISKHYQTLLLLLDVIPISIPMDFLKVFSASTAIFPCQGSPILMPSPVQCSPLVVGKCSRSGRYFANSELLVKSAPKPPFGVFFGTGGAGSRWKKIKKIRHIGHRDMKFKHDLQLFAT